LAERIISTLREIGLTDYEARAYRSLLELGVATASQVSEHAEIPYSKIYEVLNSLERKGWIETQDERPRRYYPKPPTEALEATRLKIEDRIKAWEKAIRDEVQPLYERREIRERPDIWILRGENTTIAKVKDLLEGVREEVMIAAPQLTRGLIEAVTPTLERTVESGVRILVLLSKGTDPEVLRVLSGFAEVRLRDHLFGGGIIADGREAILVLGEENKPSLTIWSDHSGLVKFAKEYFRNLWETAEPYQRDARSH
jgi:sugar-specific transcriptional regulator TrmB